MKSIRSLALPFFALFVVAVVISLDATHAAAEPGGTKYLEYRNDRWHFALAIPADMSFAEYEREGDGQSIQFSDATGNRIFTVSAWPYTQLDLTLGREGTPSAAGDQPDHPEIVDVVRDDLFTVLFQKNGARYVVVALPEDQPWLTDILTTWRFTD